MHRVNKKLVDSVTSSLMKFYKLLPWFTLLKCNLWIINIFIFYFQKPWITKSETLCNRLQRYLMVIHQSLNFRELRFENFFHLSLLCRFFWNFYQLLISGIIIKKLIFNFCVSCMIMNNSFNESS